MIQLRKILYLGIVPLLAFLLSACTSNADSPKTDNTSTATNGFAVLELFTSEGCSSCPPAEKLLEQLQKESEGKPIYILAYHVDYWDRLGWKDNFSNHAYSDRQYEYSGHFKGQVYTPQLIFNGIAEGVGSDESFVSDNLAKMLARNNTASLQITAQQQSDSLSISYKAKGTAINTRLEIALVQKHATSNVTRGENQGRTLSHAQIVRSLSPFEIGNQTTGTEKIQIPQNLNTQDCEIIALLKNTATDEIIAASRSAITN